MPTESVPEGGHCYVKMPSEPPSPGAAAAVEAVRIFDELPKVTIVAVSWPEASDIMPMLLSNTIEFKCKQFLNINFSTKEKTNFGRPVWVTS